MPKPNIEKLLEPYLAGEQPLWAKLRFDPSGCVIWTAGTFTDGYPQYRSKRAHRYVFELVRGSIPKGRHLHHDESCISILCVNPFHLTPLTPGEHNRVHKKGRRWAADDPRREAFSKRLRGNSFAKGFKHTDETRKKVSEGNKGKKLSQDHKDKIAEATRRRYANAR